MAAFEALFHSYYNALCYFASGIIRDNEAARDVVQEVFIRFWEKKPRFENQRQLTSFLYDCVRNRSLNYLEKHNNRKLLRERMELPPAAEQDYLAREVESEIYRRLSETVDRLPEQCRRVFILSYIEQREIREVAEMLSIAETTVKTQRQRAKAFLRSQLRLEDLIFFHLFCTPFSRVTGSMGK